MSFKSFILHASAKITKHAPTILILGGIGVGVTAAVMAVKKTPKLHEVITEDKKTLDHIKEQEEDPTAKFIVEQGNADDEPAVYAPYDHDVAEYDRKEVTKHMISETVKTYAIPVGLGLVSITMILLGYRMKYKALIAMTAAYNTTVASYNTYRKRVADKFGKDVENDIYLGKNTEVKEETDEEGNLKVEQVETINPVDNVLTLRFAEDTSYAYRADPQFIRGFIKNVQQTARETYPKRSIKHMYLAEITDALEMDRNMAHSGKGWCETLSDAEPWQKFDFAENTRIVYEDGKPVAYIPVMIDGVIS